VPHSRQLSECVLLGPLFDFLRLDAGCKPVGCFPLRTERRRRPALKSQAPGRRRRGGVSAARPCLSEREFGRAEPSRRRCQPEFSQTRSFLCIFGSSQKCTSALEKKQDVAKRPASYGRESRNPTELSCSGRIRDGHRDTSSLGPRAQGVPGKEAQAMYRQVVEMVEGVRQQLAGALRGRVRRDGLAHRLLFRKGDLVVVAVDEHVDVDPPQMGLFRTSISCPDPRME